MKVFVVSPHHQDPDFDIKQSILSDLAERYNIDLLSVDMILDIDASLESLTSADIVLADLSYARPSCYYEVGYAQAKGKIVHVIAKKGTIIYQLRSRENIRFFADIEQYKVCIDELFASLTDV